MELVLRHDPKSRFAADGMQRVQKAIDERNEKLKNDMMDKLKGLGNSLLGKFGLSLDNFKMDKDPQTGSYSINFQQ